MHSNKAVVYHKTAFQSKIFKFRAMRQEIKNLFRVIITDCRKYMREHF